jgi:diguanylate cyclase (GGDEF)-like protein/PAS domain S-box-containing protein
MSGILVVERSATLRHLLARTLHAAQYSKWSELTAYTDALDHLQQAQRLNQGYRVLLLGAPARATPDFLKLLQFLREPSPTPLPVLLLAHERTAELAHWADTRPDTQFIPWSQFGRLPAAIRQFAPDAEPEAEPVARKAGNGIRVLFVDDSASVRLAYQQLLERDGFSVDTAATVAEAIDKARTGRFDLAVVDYFLPDGDGDELCRRLREAPTSAHTMIAIITGTYREDIIKRCLEAGAVECMFKNEAKELFLARVGSLARQIQMQKKVAAEKQRLDGILGSVGDGVYGVDGEGLVTFLNPTGMRMLGMIDETDVVGKSAHALFHHSDESGRALDPTQSPLTRAYADGQAVNAWETVFWTRERTAVPVECSVLPLEIGGRREGSVVVFRNIGERKSADRLRWELAHDALTGLYNARHFNHALSQEVTRRREQGGYAALLYIDIDRFTHVFDAGGAAVADQLVVDISQQFAKRLREGDVLARLEGDRMALLLTAVQLDNLFTIADGFREFAHGAHYVANDVRRHATVSLGVSIVSRETPSAEYALERARVACKLAKQRGRDQTQIYVGEHELRVARELEAGWSERFRSAIEEDRFVFEVQPIVPLDALPSDEARIVERQGWRLDGTGANATYLFELLVRMVGKNGEIISPGVFVPLAERVGMMPKIDLWILNRALRYLSNLQADSARFAFNVNLSNQTLAEPETLKFIADAVRAANAPPGRLVFEITETSEMQSLHNVRRFIHTMKGLGCRFALDDFGTGFSSFTHLRHLPVDFVKIEGSFVEGMAGSDLDYKMVQSIAALAKSLQMRVIAEHVDSYGTLTALRSCGVDLVQGHYLGAPRPLNEVDFAALLNRA